MAELREKIENLRFANSNIEGRFFVPETALRRITSKSAIEIALQNLQLPIHEVRDLTHGILHGAQKCFAILLLIGYGNAIVGFFRSDSMQHSSPDDRLPYTSEALQRVFQATEASPQVRNFLERQWEFCVPILQQDMIFREFDPHVILPFLESKDIGRGSMGSATKVKLHSQCHQLPVQAHEVVKKELERGGRDGFIGFEKELKNLALLAHLKHPNIVQLYCSYTYRDKYNLIFAVADHGSLDALFRSRIPPAIALTSRLLPALAELASGLDALHNFASKVYDLSLSGCHHDLAPRNILVHGETLLLADFGLSTFHEAEEDSLTAFREVRGAYIAPECQHIQNNRVETRTVGRASDIWSFGCVISEVLTYMVWGATGVELFRKARRVEITPELEWYRFHKGPETPNPEVDRWLEKLMADGDVVKVRLVVLIRRMLSIDPQKRPLSTEVWVTLRGIAVLSIANTVNQLLATRINIRGEGVGRFLFEMQFQSWLYGFNELLDGTRSSNHKDLACDFPTMSQALSELLCSLRSEQYSTSDAIPRQMSFFKYQQTRLSRALPLRHRTIAEDHLITLIMGIPDAHKLGDLSVALRERGNDEVGILVAVRCLTVLAESGQLIEQPHLMLDQRDITLRPDNTGDWRAHTTALMESSSEPVLVERLEYKEIHAQAVVGLELRRRLASIVNLLHHESSAQIPGAPRCRGLYHDPAHRAFGIVYNIPHPDSAPIDLHRLIAHGDKSRPPLEFRFQLAYDICRCIFAFHQVGWLHRRLHSRNVFFFPQIGTHVAEQAKDPQVLGFAASREDQLYSFTQGPEEDMDLWIYQHPEYLSLYSRFRKEFDYYSLGMILLEIGFWKTLPNLTKSSQFRNISHQQFRHEVIRSRVSQLRIVMGTRYMVAVQRCLEGGFGLQSTNSNSQNDICQAFKQLVVDQLLQII